MPRQRTTDWSEVLDAWRTCVVVLVEDGREVEVIRGERLLRTGRLLSILRLSSAEWARLRAVLN